MTTTTVNPEQERSSGLRGGRIDGIDGLRAIAVGLVLAYHLWPNKVPGGFVGVDVFFVLSGFLITRRLIIELRSTNHIDLRQFWLRRARRLLPALVLVVMASTAVALLVDRNLLVDIARQWVGAFTFSTNWVEISAGTDYFAATEEQLLNPLWSLAVEEQFYLVWPVAFTFMARRGMLAGRSSGIALMVAGASAVLMAVLLTSPEAATRVYYGSDTHIFGLMIGAALAYQFADPDSLFHRHRWQHLRRWLGFAGLILLALVLTTLGSTNAWTYQGGLLIASVLTAIIISTLPGDRSMLVGLLELAPLSWIGRRSYGIYLWHWPILLIVRELLPARAPGAGVDVQTAVLVLGITAALSAMSFQLIERPINRSGFREFFADRREALHQRAAGDKKDSPLRLLPLGLFAAVVVLAVIAAATAPRITDAQRSVEEGQRLIAAQGGAQAAATSAPTAVPAGASSVEPTLTAAPEPRSETPVAADAETHVDDADALEGDDGADLVVGLFREPADDTDSEPPATTVVPQPATVPTTAPSPTASPPAEASAEATASATATESESESESVTTRPTAEADSPPSAPPVTTAAPAPAMSGTNMVGVGDSVMSGAAPAMFERFPGLHIAAASSKQWDDAPQMIDQLQAQGLLRDIVVLNFGTNAGLTEERLVNGLRETIERIGPNRQVIVVTVVGISFWVPESNVTLRTVASAYPNVTIVDWHSTVQRDPSLLHNDRTHPNLRGISVYAELIAQALKP